MFLLLVVLLCTLSLCYYLVSSYRSRNGPPAITMLDFVTGKYKMDASRFTFLVTEWGKKFNGIFKLGSLYIVDSKELAHNIYITQDPVFADRAEDSFIPSHEVFFKSQDILQRKYDSTLQMLRKCGFKSLQMYGAGLETFEAIVRDELVELLDHLDNSEGTAVDPSSALEASLINIVSTLLFGDKFNYESEEVRTISSLNYEILHMVEIGDAQELFDNPLAWLLLKIPINRYQKIRRKMDACIRLRDQAFHSIVHKYKEQDHTGCSNSVLASLLADQESYGRDILTDQMVEGVLLDLIIAGSSTTRAAVRGLIYTMASLPEVQETVFAELSNITGGSRLARVQDREETPYTAAVILEQLRLQSIAPLGVTRYSSQESKLNSYRVPKGAPIMINQWAIHHNPDNWERPNEFFPQHFLDDDGRLLTADVYKNRGYYPFGAGRRVCLGESLAKSRLFLVFSALVQRFHILPPEGVKMPKVTSECFVINLTSEAPEYKVRFVRRV